MPNDRALLRPETSPPDASPIIDSILPPDQNNGPGQPYPLEVRYVEVGNLDSTGWTGMAKTVKDYDEEKILFCKEDIDTLLVFAGLYSAILSAFIIESYQKLQPDSSDQLVVLFQKFLAQNYTLGPGFLNSTTPYPTLPDFEAPTWAIRVNILWFSSLILSLASASFGMLVKQWLREYLKMAYTSPQERLRARQYRHKSMEHWKVFEIAASLPLMLEMSVLLFFIGLCYFTFAVHLSIGRTTVPLVCGWAFVFILATIAPLFSPRCPLKTTLLESSMKHGRKTVITITKTIIFPLFHKLQSLSSRTSGLVARLHAVFSYTVRALQDLTLTITSAPRSLLQHLATTVPQKWIEYLESHMLEEEDAMTKTAGDDFDLLTRVAELMPGDGILPTIVDMARRQRPPPALEVVVKFVENVLRQRVGEVDAIIPPLLRIPDLRLLTTQAWEAAVNLLADSLHNQSLIASPPVDMELLSNASQTLVSLVLSQARQIPASARRGYNSVLTHPHLTLSIDARYIETMGTLPPAYISSLHQFIEQQLIRANTSIVFDKSSGRRSSWVVSALRLLLTLWKQDSSRKIPFSSQLASALVHHHHSFSISPGMVARPNPSYANTRSSDDDAHQVADFDDFVEEGQWVSSDDIWQEEEDVDSANQLLVEDDQKFNHDVFHGLLAASAQSLDSWEFRWSSIPPALSTIFDIPLGQSLAHQDSADIQKELYKVIQSTKKRVKSSAAVWLQPGRRGILVDVLIYDFVSSDDAARSAILDEMLALCRIAISFSAEGSRREPARTKVDFCSLLCAISRLKTVVYQREKFNLSHICKLEGLSKAAERAISARYIMYQFLLRVGGTSKMEGIIDMMRDEGITVAYALCYFLRGGRKARQNNTLSVLTSSGAGVVSEEEELWDV